MAWHIDPYFAYAICGLRENLDVLRLTFWDVIGDGKGVTCTRRNGDEFDEMDETRINLFPCQVLTKTHGELRTPAKAINANDGAKVNLLHAAGQCPQKVVGDKVGKFVCVTLVCRKSRSTMSPCKRFLVNWRISSSLEWRRKDVNFLDMSRT